MPSTPLVVAVAQPRCQADAVEANVAAHEAVIRSASARVVVFPELSLTGYELDAPALGIDDDRLAPLVAACVETGTVALVGAPLQLADGGAAIAVLAVDAEGVTVVYRKVHVDETESRFTPGVPAKIEVDGWRLGLGVCKDTGIAEHAAATAALGIDAYLAGTVMFPDEAEKQDGRARRIATEHQVFTAFASFAGPTGGGYSRTAGRSGIWAPDGSLLARAGSTPDTLARATLTPAPPPQPLP